MARRPRLPVLPRPRVIVLGASASLIVEAALILWVAHGLGFPSDFPTEAWPAYRALAHGDLLEFFRIGPGYVGSLVLRAPFALPAIALGGGWRATYFASAIPCLIAGPLLGAWLSGRVSSAPAGGPLSWRSPFAWLALNPLVCFCLIFGHPEELLGASLAVAAVVLAADGRAPTRAGWLLALAVFNKPWALVVVPVAFAVMPAARRRALVAFLLPAGALYAPMLAVHQTATGLAGALGSATGAIFYPTYLGWWLGPGAWSARHAHMLLVIIAGCAAAGWWLRARSRPIGDGRPADALALLALVLALRCALDPWNNIYYEVPFVLALAAIEHDRRPALTVLFSALALFVLRPAALYPTSWDVRALAFDLLAVPTIAALLLRVYASPRTWRRACAGARARARAQRADPAAAT